MAEWLIPWTERGRSGPIHDSFLWRAGNLYVMDNHRLALWCWWQHLDDSARGWTFHHIDRHYDALWQGARPWTRWFDQSHRSELNAFRTATWRENGDEPLELYRWDAITSALMTLNGNVIREWTFATAREGDPLPLPGTQEVDPWDLPAHLRYLAEIDDASPPAIVDIDVDYFSHADVDGAFGRVFSDDYIRELGASLMAGVRNERFGIVTVALSPTTTGTWQLAEDLCWTLLEGHPELRHLRAGAP